MTTDMTVRTTTTNTSSAFLSAMCSREYLAGARRVRREGQFPTIDDPAR